MSNTVAYPLTEARKRLGNISHAHAYKLIREGRLKTVKLGRRTVITEQAIADCLAASTN